MRRGAKPAKAKGESKRPLARKSGKGEGSRVGDLEKRLAEALKHESEALEQQRATAEILRVISASPSDVSPVFRAIVRSATRLCDATFGTVFRFDGELITVAANQELTAEEIAITNAVFPAPATRGIAAGRAIVDRAVVHISDIRNDPDYVARAPVNAPGYRTALAVPMLKEGSPIGAFVMWRREVRPFTDKQIELVRTFADQAVIAIENVRLFNELERRNRDLTEALERQTATSDILQIISSSPTEVQPVFDVIIRSAVTLCDASFGGLHLFDGEQITLDAHSGLPEEELEVLRTVFPFPIRSNSLLGRALLERSPVQVEDVRAIPGYHSTAIQSLARYRTGLGVPMLREGTPIGGLVLWRSEVRPFTDRQIELIMTFASQAVIAVENVRLFTELQEKNLALTEAHAHVSEALEQRTATAEILSVISRSPTDLQPVFDTIIRSAVRLCDGLYGTAVRFDGEMMHLAAGYNYTPEVRQALEDAFPMRPDRRMMAGRAILARAVIQVGDALEDPEYAQDVARAGGFRSMLAVPMMREGNPIGAIVVNRGQAGSFSVSQIDLLKTFADQAVIAIENVRLFTELETRNTELTEALEQQTATSEVLKVISRSAFDLQPVLETLLENATRLCAAEWGVIFRPDGEGYRMAVVYGASPEFSEFLARTPIPPGRGSTVGRAAMERRTVQIADVSADPEYQITDFQRIGGFRTVLAVPMLREGVLLGVFGLHRDEVRPFTDKQIQLVATFADQAAIAIENVRLFREIEDKSRQLEVASQHKSEFLANMSHELRTPLNAIIGFSEVLVDRMFGELNEKQDEYLKDIYASGQHLLSLINDILDLSKIEAGRMELELTNFDVRQAIANALMLVRERAVRRGIALHERIDERLGQITADERKVKQVLLNLLSNAIKFTPEGGRIEVVAVPKDGLVEVSVSDTGAGIAPEDQEAVFEEFRQVGAAEKKAEGTGLGLTLCRKFVELHGGRIWVQSQVDVGSTFTFTIPVRRGE